MLEPQHRYNGYCIWFVHINRPNTLISNYSSTDMFIFNINRWIFKIYVLIPNKILHLRASPGVEFVISNPKTCSSYTCIQYSDITCNTLLRYSDMCRVADSIIVSSSYDDIGVSLECRPFQILGEDVSLVGRAGYPCDHQYSCFL